MALMTPPAHRDETHGGETRKNETRKGKSEATPTSVLAASRLPVFPEPMPMLPSDLTWLLDADQQMDLLQRDLHRTQPQKLRIQKRKAILRALGLS